MADALKNYLATKDKSAPSTITFTSETSEKLDELAEEYSTSRSKLVNAMILRAYDEFEEELERQAEPEPENT